MNYTNKKLKITNTFSTRVTVGTEDECSLFDSWNRFWGGDDCFVENAERLCAIWNYCKGHPTETFEGKEFGTVRDALRTAVAEMERMLRVIEYVEESEHWDDATSGTGIATSNGYRKALETATKALKEIEHGTDTGI